MRSAYSRKSATSSASSTESLPVGPIAAKAPTTHLSASCIGTATAERPTRISSTSRAGSPRRIRESSSSNWSPSVMVCAVTFRSGASANSGRLARSSFPIADA